MALSYLNSNRTFFTAAAAIAIGVATACTPNDKQIKEWVEKNPEVILKSVADYQQKMQQENQPKGEMVSQYSKELFQSESPTTGPADGKIQIAYFFDFNCGHCAKQGQVIAEVLKRKDNVKIIFKNIPILSPTSETAARAALAAHQQGKYYDFYKELFSNHDRTPEAYKSIAKKLKLDMAKWEKDLNGEAVTGELTRTRELAMKMKISGTPVLAIAPNQIFPGRVDQLGEIVDKM